MFSGCPHGYTNPTAPIKSEYDGGSENKYGRFWLVDWVMDLYCTVY
jgi:hypothetical protein